MSNKNRNKSIDLFVTNASVLKYLPLIKSKKIVLNILNHFNIRSAHIEIVYLNDDDIRFMNNQYLKHDYITDVISFELGEDDFIDGEIYIGVQRAAEQAAQYKVSLNNELLRLIAHGTLHILGFDDDNEEKRDFMNKMETDFIKQMK